VRPSLSLSLFLPRFLPSVPDAPSCRLPTLATVLAFITYANTGHDTTAQSIFTSLTLFQLCVALSLSSCHLLASSC